jgi:hypothetical protein
MELFTKLFGNLLAFVYHCFDRIVIHGYLSALSRPEQVVQGVCRRASCRSPPSSRPAPPAWHAPCCRDHVIYSRQDRRIVDPWKFCTVMYFDRETVALLRTTLDRSAAMIAVVDTRAAA